MDERNEVLPPAGSAALVVIEFPSFRDFIDSYSPIISEDGIFIRNADVSESNAFSVGDHVDFEVRLKDDFRLIQGAGQVVWLGNAEAAGGASGTAIRFHDVDEPSQRLISRLVGNYVNGGGKLFEVGAEVGPEVVDETTGEVSGEEPELLVMAPEESAELPGLLDNQELTAETLRASEAETLFATDPEVEPPTPLEFESVSVGDVEASDLKAETSESPSFNPDDPVGLETIAIPSGLVSKLASEAAQTQEDDAELDSDTADTADTAETAETEDDAPIEIDATLGGELGEIDGFVGDLDPEPIELPASSEDPAGADAVLEAAEAAVSAAAPDHFEVPLSNELDDDSLAAAAGAMDADLGVGGAFSGEIAEVAEELSGVHRIEMPDSEEASGVTYAGSASARPERSSGGRIAALAVAAVLLGAGAFYFQDSIRGFLGLGGGEDGAVPTDLVHVGEAMPPMGGEAVDGAVEPGAATGGEPGDSIEPDGGHTATGDGASGDLVTDGATAAADTAADSAGDSGAKPQEAARQTPPVATSRAAIPTVVPNERRIERITWREDGDSTIVTIRLNTELSKAYLEVVRVREGAPRQVIKIQGVNVPYSPSEVAIGSSHLLRLRTGLHRVEGGSVLHVVADLADAGVEIVSVEPKGRDLEFTFS